MTDLEKQQNRRAINSGELAKQVDLLVAQQERLRESLAEMSNAVRILTFYKEPDAYKKYSA